MSDRVWILTLTTPQSSSVCGAYRTQKAALGALGEEVTQLESQPGQVAETVGMTKDSVTIACGRATLRLAAHPLAD